LGSADGCKDKNILMSEAQVVTPITIRSASAADIPAIEAVIRPYVDQRLLLARTFDELEDLLPHCFVAVDATGAVVGCAALEIYSPKLAEVRSLAVAASAQGFGVGRMLVEACLARAHEQRVFEVMAITTRDSFFQTCGFDYTLPGEKRALFYQTRDYYSE